MVAVTGSLPSNLGHEPAQRNPSAPESDRQKRLVRLRGDQVPTTPLTRRQGPVFLADSLSAFGGGPMAQHRSRSAQHHHQQRSSLSTGGIAHMTHQLIDRTSAATGAASTPLGELPPVGEVPATMLAQVVRQGRFGDAATAFQV